MVSIKLLCCRLEVWIGRQETTGCDRSSLSRLWWRRLRNSGSIVGTATHIVLNFPGNHFVTVMLLLLLKERNLESMVSARSR